VKSDDIIVLLSVAILMVWMR